MSSNPLKCMTLLSAVVLTVATSVIWVGTPSASATTQSQLRVLTYNIRRGAEPAGKRWADREAAVVALIRSNTPGIIGLQEVRTDLTDDAGVAMNTYLESSLAKQPTGGDKYAAIVPPSVPGDNAVNIRQNLIFYKDSGKFVRVSNGVVPFNTPHASPDCVADGHNMAWAIIKDTTTDPDNLIFVVNTHLTNGSTCAAQRVSEVKQIHQGITSHDPNHYPVIVMGDMNTDNDASENTLDLLGESSGASAGTSYEHWYNLDPTVPLSNNAATFNTGWTEGNDSAADQLRIDYIFAGTKFSADLQKIDTSRYSYSGGSYSPSDHYAVFARLTLTP